MTLAGLAGFLRPATVFINENNTMTAVFCALRVLRVSRKPQREKKINEINACGLRVLAALRAGFSTRKRMPAVGALRPGAKQKEENTVFRLRDKLSHSIKKPPACIHTSSAHCLFARGKR